MASIDSARPSRRRISVDDTGAVGASISTIEARDAEAAAPGSIMRPAIDGSADRSDDAAQSGRDTTAK